MDFAERFASILTAEGGMPRMPARVFACILADDAGELTAGELAAQLGVSPAAISGAVRYLVQTGVVMRVRKPGARSDHYRVGDDVFAEIYGRREPQLARYEQILADWVEEVGRDSPAGRRLDKSREYFAFMRAELPALMDRWYERRARR